MQNEKVREASGVFFEDRSQGPWIRRNSFPLGSCSTSGRPKETPPRASGHESQPCSIKSAYHASLLRAAPRQGNLIRLRRGCLCASDSVASY